MTTPPPLDKEGDDEASTADAEALLQSRRRALVSLLRQLAAEPDDSFNVKGSRLLPFGTPAIRVIESKARRELQSKTYSQQQHEELRTRMGQNLETPKYEILAPVSREIGVEIRQYEPFTVCSVVMGAKVTQPSNNDADETKPKASAGSFNTLAAYLFGKNQQQKPMKMTTPVLLDGEGDGRQMSFVLPSEFWSSESLPKAPQPIQGSGVSLALQQAQQRAVVMFGGYATKVETNRRKEQLMQGIASSKDWEVVPGASTTLSQYNDPFTPAWKRLNEVSIQVQRKN
jgi:hypothetical protein